ncbi:hypothetical protein LTR70_008751 [Exophiala xenobiotica]|uniref:Protochlorophyllide reductase n=1 Tax=Lithohypha guttulata TaxID=1690604 RepID=A0ABR0JZI7_9EURO|nr:hypothetical protein LTR24_008565 [Lithohypha guttulata]KAK5311524.1 hypothetical protein LTR70_008751 [Exophiala xenobiotica]
MAAFTSTILITGGTTGLGYYTALLLAQRLPSAKIIIASRTDKVKAADTLNHDLQKETKTSTTSSIKQIEYLPLDLSSTPNIRAFVANYASKSYPPITALLLNAGLQYHSGKDLRLSADGIEITFAVNHLGHALLFFLLKPHLASNARIVITSSGTHDPAQKTPFEAKYESAELLAHPTDKEGYATRMKGGQRYASSKLANVLFTYALDRRLKAAHDSRDAASWTVCAMDPGLMPGTALGRDAGAIVLWLFMHVATRLVWLLRLLTGNQNVHLPQESAANLARLASMVGKDAHESSGAYFEGGKEIDSSVASHDEGKQEDLWQWTVNFLARDEDEKKAFETF